MQLALRHAVLRALCHIVQQALLLSYAARSLLRCEQSEQGRRIGAGLERAERARKVCVWGVCGVCVGWRGVKGVGYV